MTTENKLKKLKAEGWVVHFSEPDFNYTAVRGFLIIRANNVSKLYKDIKKSNQ